MATYPDGTLLKAGGPEVARMEGGQRRWIPDPATFTCMGLNWGAIQTISDSEWNQIPQGTPYPSRADAALLQGSGPQVYVMDGCQRHWIPDPATFSADGYDWNAIQHISDTDLTAIPEGVQLPAIPGGVQLPAIPEGVQPQLTLVQIQQKHLELTQQLTTIDQQLQSIEAQLGNSQQMTTAEMALLQSQMAAASQRALSVAKEASDTLQSILRNIE